MRSLCCTFRPAFFKFTMFVAMLCVGSIAVLQRAMRTEVRMDQRSDALLPVNDTVLPVSGSLTRQHWLLLLVPCVCDLMGSWMYFAALLWVSNLVLVHAYMVSHKHTHT